MWGTTGEPMAKDCSAARQPVPGSRLARGTKRRGHELLCGDVKEGRGGGCPRGGLVLQRKPAAGACLSFYINTSFL